MKNKIDKQLFILFASLAWPTIVEELLDTVIQYVDTAMVGHLGAKATATISLSSTYNWLINSIMWALGVGFLSYIARSIGEKNYKNVKHAASFAIAATFLIGGILTLVTLAISPFMPVWMGADSDIRRAASEYFALINAPMIFRASMIILGAAVRATGDTRKPMFITVFVNLINTGLNYIFIYLLGFGAIGAGYATAISYVIGGLMMGYVFSKNRVLWAAVDEGDVRSQLGDDRECDKIERFEKPYPDGFGNTVSGSRVNENNVSESRINENNVSGLRGNENHVGGLRGNENCISESSVNKNHISGSRINENELGGSRIKRNIYLYKVRHYVTNMMSETAVLKSIIAIGLPVMFTQIASCLGYIVATSFVSSMSTVIFAAHSIAITAETIFYIPGYGMQTATATLIGNALGERDLRKQKHVSYIAIGTIFSMMCVSGLLLFLGADFMMSLFTKDEQVIRIGARLLRIVAFTEPVFGTSAVMNGIYNGLGRTKYPFYCELISRWGVRILGSFVVVKCFGFGIDAVWYCMIADNIVKAVLLLGGLVSKKKN